MSRLTVDAYRYSSRVIYVYATPDLLDELDKYGEVKPIMLTRQFPLENEYEIHVPASLDFGEVVRKLEEMGNP